MQYCLERRNRIRILLAAYAYEYLDEPIMTDTQFDELALKINLEAKTGKHDGWFKKHFNPHTGQWIRQFPKKEQEKLAKILKKCFN